MKLTSLLFLSFCFFKNYAQNGTQQIISTAGSYANVSGNQLNYTIGEVLVPTFKGGDNYLTQGFNQPSNFIINSVQNVSAAFTLNTYPNPTQDIVNIDITGTISAPLSMEMYDDKGSRISPFLLENDRSKIRFNMQEMPSGFYTLRLVNPTDNSFSTIKIVKIH